MPQSDTALGPVFVPGLLAGQVLPVTGVASGMGVATVRLLTLLVLRDRDDDALQAVAPSLEEPTAALCLPAARIQLSGRAG